MTNERHIGNIQLFALLVLSRLFALLCGGAAAAEELMVYALGFVAAQLVAGGLLLRFVSPRIPALLEKPLFRAALWLLCALVCADTVLGFFAYMTAEFAGLYGWAVAAALAAAVLLAVYRGTEALARGAAVLLGLLLAALAAMLLGLSGGYDLLKLSRPVLTSGGAAAYLRQYSGWEELLALTVLAPAVGRFRRGLGAAWALASLLLWELLLAACALTLGGYAAFAPYPVLTALSAFSGGAEALCLLLPAVCCFVRAALFLELCCFAWRGGLRLLPKGKTAALNTAAVSALAAALLLTGCSAGVDISSRAVATAAFVERRADGMTVTLECVSDTRAEEPEYTVYSAQGVTFSECITAMRRAGGIDPYLAGCRWLVLYGAQSRGEIASLLRLLEADGRLPRTVRVAAGYGFLPEGGESSAARLLDTELGDFEYTLIDTLERCSAEGRGLLLPLAGEGGVFCGYLSPNSASAEYLPADTGGALADYAAQEGVIVTLRGDTAADVALESCRIGAEPLAGESPRFGIKITARGYISSMEGDISLAKTESLLAERLYGDLCALLDGVVKNGGNDIFSLGRIMSLRQPKLWQKYAGSWERALPELEYSVELDIKLTDKKQLLSR